MKHVLSTLCLLGSLLHASTRCTAPASEFHLQGDYLIGGLFDIHHASSPPHHTRPEAIDCSSQPILLPNYRRFQLMRFAVEQINNSTNLLPDVSLGYEMFDQCSDIQNFPGILKLASASGFVHPWGEPHQQQAQKSNESTVIAVIGTFTSRRSLTAAPLFMVNLIPMVSYGASSSAFSAKMKYPSFLRTVHPNKDIIEVIVNMVLYFNWRWVAFLNSDNDYGIDGLAMFLKRIEDTNICLAYHKDLNDNTNYSLMFKQIEAQDVHVIIVFSSQLPAESLIEAAIQLNITNKVWIADEGWSLNKKLAKLEGIKNIGTILGMCQSAESIPGFTDFIYSTKSQLLCGDEGRQEFCNQNCNCSSLSAEDILTVDPSFSFPVYAATYAIAHALHNALQCGGGRCNKNITVYPHKVLEELKKSNFTLLNQHIQFDENGDPKFGGYDVVFWNDSGDAQKIGFHQFYPSVHFSIDSTKIKWYTNGEVPTSVCSQECHAGYAKKQLQGEKCCFTCRICPNGTYINRTEDPYDCIDCKDTEWSAEGSTSCNLRLVEFIPFTDSGAILIMLGAGALVGLTLVVSVLFAINYNTPVVRSAGGPMCFLILGCLSLCSISVFFYFGKPSVPSCVLRFLPCLLFYTVCLACFVVRSFQIVCIKDLPKNYNEAKAITFCLLLLILTWIIFATEYMLYRGKYIHTFNALAVLSSLYCFLLWYFLPKCYIIILQPHKNTPQYFQGLIQNYTKTISQ
ncbi:taste receptor type 1 member 1-like [Stegastes partitus]|uniref:Taste receptor type 1 member 1-like n=1 Tax=Stegastes partitus TaxID=144197 RepID=A0A9Y4N839_9TELE|nr:PREDICTED: taste receptor type 1 member 1-like [Stegastes partitus]